MTSNRIQLGRRPADLDGVLRFGEDNALALTFLDAAGVEAAWPATPVLEFATASAPDAPVAFSPTATMTNAGKTAQWVVPAVEVAGLRGKGTCWARLRLNGETIAAGSVRVVSRWVDGGPTPGISVVGVVPGPPGSAGIDAAQWTQGAGWPETISGKLGDGTDVEAATDVGLAGKADAAALNAHTFDHANPHGVTKAQVGLGDADNTPDMGKPVSVAQQAALDSKADLDPDTGLVEASQLPPIPDSDWDSITGKPELNPFKHEIYLDDVPPEWGLPPGTQMPWAARVKAEGDGDWFGADTDADGDQIVDVATLTSLSAMMSSIFSTVSGALGGKAEASDLTDHVEDTDNPHEVTAAQVGLDKVQNIPSPHYQKWFGGRWYGPVVGGVNTAPMANANQRSVNFVPVWVPEVVTVDQLSLEITTAGKPGQVFRLGIYDNNPAEDIPGNLLVSTGDILGSSTGHKIESITPTVLQPGWNWLAEVANDDTMACRRVVGTLPPVAADIPGVYPGNVPRANYSHGYQPGAAATFDATAPSTYSALLKFGTVPYVMVRCQP
jgi:hypothetical protein